MPTSFVKYNENKVETRISAYFYIFLSISTALLIISSITFAASLWQVSDTISTSAPGTGANHTIQFNTSTTIPASGKIIITPQAGAFTIPAGLDYTDIDIKDDGADLALDTVAGSGPGSVLGVSVTSGTSGSITFTLNDTDEIATSSQIQIEIGTNATASFTGDSQITNPSTVNSYTIGIETQNSGGTKIDSGTAMIAVVNQITVTGDIATEETPVSSPAVSITVEASGGGSGIKRDPSNIVFKGEAPRGSEVIILDEGKVVTSVIVSSNAEFLALLEDIASKLHTFSLYLIDLEGRVSPLITIETNVALSRTTTIENIILPPTIGIETEAITQGEEVEVAGRGIPNARIKIEIEGSEDPIGETETGSDGAYSFIVPTKDLREGIYTIYVYTEKEGTRSEKSLPQDIKILPSKFSKVQSPKIGEEPPTVIEQTPPLTTSTEPDLPDRIEVPKEVKPKPLPSIPKKSEERKELSFTEILIKKIQEELPLILSSIIFALLVFFVYKYFIERGK